MMLSFSVIPKTTFSTGFKVMANPPQQPTPPPETPTPIGVKTRSGESLGNVDKIVKLGIKERLLLALLEMFCSIEGFEDAAVAVAIGETFCGGSDFIHSTYDGITKKQMPPNKVMAFFVPFMQVIRKGLFRDKFFDTTRKLGYSKNFFMVGSREESIRRITQNIPEGADQTSMINLLNEIKPIKP
jgi:hypothetical protein